MISRNVLLSLCGGLHCSSLLWREVVLPPAFPRLTLIPTNLGRAMKPYIIVSVTLSACLACGYACYRLGQTSGFEMGFTQGMYSFAKTADEQRKQSNGDVVFKGAEWPDTLRGLGDLREQSGAADFVPWKHNSSVPSTATHAQPVSTIVSTNE